MANETTKLVSSSNMNIRDTASRLAELPWRFIDLKNVRFAIKCLVSYSSYDILVTDCVSMWREALSGELIIARNNKLNPNIETSPSRLLHHLEELVENSDKENTLDAIFCPHNELTITSHSKLSGYIFRWEFHLAPVDESMFSEQLTKPLIVMVAELSRRQQEMFTILESKDAQINDYKAEGVKLSRSTNGHLIPLEQRLTGYKDDKPFDKSKFCIEMAQSKEFADMVKSPEEVAFSPITQTLYTEIAKQIFKNSSNSVKQKNEFSSRDGLTNAEPLVEKNNPADSSKATSGTDVLPTPVSEKDLELERRNRLKLKLEEDKVKKDVQRKKKKLNL